VGGAWDPAHLASLSGILECKSLKIKNARLISKKNSACRPALSLTELIMRCSTLLHGTTSDFSFQYRSTGIAKLNNG